ncbi:MAG: response regulator transcription factor [Planctomycetota bacterium]
MRASGSIASDSTVVLVDDDEIALSSTRWLCEQAGFVTQCFTSAEELLASDVFDCARCMVLDLRMPGMDGLELQRRLKELKRRIPLIFLTGYGDVPSCAQAFRTGAFDFLEKPVNGRFLVERIRECVLRGAGISDVHAASEMRGGLERLTDRERQVMDLLVRGRTMKQIANLWHVSVQTIWKHRSKIFAKLGVDSEVALARLLANLPIADEQAEADGGIS